MQSQRLSAPTLEREHFREPRASHRPAPLWTWNGRVTADFIVRELNRFKQQGFGGVFIHPRPGLETEYLSEAWFDLWDIALKTAASLGMECHIYDENSYPSGFAGGHVASRFPMAVAQYAVPRHVDRLPHPTQCNVLAVFDLSSGAPESVALETGREGKFLLIELRKGQVNPWTAHFPFVDTCQPQVAELFLQCTHQAYHARFGERFGKEIKYCFTDEPTVARHDPHDKSLRLPMSRMLLREFEKEHGYDLASRLADLYLQTATCSGTRFDYYLTLQRVWTHNFLRPISNWCREHNIAFTGHLMEHEWPVPVSHPNTMDALRWFQVPGVDLLAFQFDFDDYRKNASYLVNIKEAASVADQLGSERVLSETHGAGGHRVRFDQFKALCDWQMVHGVDLVNPHMSCQTLAGARKYDWPQTYSDHSPWFEHYHLQAEHTARLSEALTMGKRCNRVLLLHPTSSAWLRYSPYDFSQRYQVSGFTKELRDSQGALVQRLAENQIDFDLGDELLLRDFGSAADGKLKLGRIFYEMVIIPEGMDNWLGSTLANIESYLASGGTVMTLREPPSHINGRPDNAAAGLPSRFPDQWITFTNTTALLKSLRASVKPRISGQDSQALPAALHHQYRALENGHIHLLVNASHKAISTTLRIHGQQLVELDTFSGMARAVDTVSTEDGILEIRHHFPALGHLLLLADSGWEPDEPSVSSQSADGKPIELKFQRAYPEDDNVLPLMYCNLQLPSGATLEDISVMEANEKLWQAQGFDNDIWDRAVQFSDNYRHFSFDASSAYALRYDFNCEESPAALSLAVERPQLYEIKVNGRAIDFSDAACWFDEEIRQKPIEALVQAGTNTIELGAAKFNVRCEVDRIYLLGKFTVIPGEKGFAIAAASPSLQPGDWTHQGMPFYRGAVTYEYEVELPDWAKSWRITAAGYDGALALLACDGKPIGHAAFPPFQVEAACPGPGRHTLSVRIVGDLRNMLGPYFGNASPAHYWAWRNAPSSLPPGKDFHPMPQGLRQAPRVEIWS